MAAARRLKIGIFFNARREQGGLYQYALTLVDCLRGYVPEHDFILFQAILEDMPDADYPSNWQVIRLPARAVKMRMGIEMGLMSLARLGWLWPPHVLPEYPQVRQAGLDGMIYVKPNMHSFMWPYPAVFPVHDLQHRLQKRFPEVSAGGEYLRREMIYRNAVPRARGVLTDSETGREDVLEAYHPAPERVFALPYLTPTYLSTQTSPEKMAQVRQKYHLPQDYLFYPAAFWMHKNHDNLVKALGVLRNRHGLRLPLVLAGSRKHRYEAVKQLVEDLGLADQVHFLGYVPDDDMPALYRQAFSLVMPTFFGPTNIPVLEAWQHDCAVISSDLRGIRQQVGDAGLLADPESPEAIAAQVYRLWQEPGLRAALVARGRQKVSSWTPQLLARRLAEILVECFS
jgi:glycosyltransferase involved in cell wall biosynthesis